jgi:hypothetical protein
MTDDQLRALVRDAIARHMAGAPASVSGPGTYPAAGDGAGSTARALPPATAQVAVTANAPGGVAIAIAPGAHVHLHVSHATLDLPPMSHGPGDGPCDIEPSAACNRCGFCQSYGH